jgi:hypothetical protein
MTNSTAQGVPARPSPREAEVRAAIERYAAAWLRGDLAAIVDCYHDDFTLHYFGSNALSGRHEGKPAALATLADFSRRTNRTLRAVVATMAGPERGSVVAREALGLGDGAVEVERVLVYAVRDGRLGECWVYDQDQALIDRLVGDV